MLLLAQVVFVACLLSLGGALVFELVVTPRALAHVPAARLPAVCASLGRWLAACLLGCGFGLVAWLAAETINLAGSPRAVGLVLGQTSFGHVVIVQAGLLALTGTVLAPGGARPRHGRRWPASRRRRRTGTGWRAAACWVLSFSSRSCICLRRRCGSAACRRC